MGNNFYTILTDIGLAKVTNSQITNEKINLIEMAIGDGGGTHYNPTSDMSELRNEVWRGAIGSVEIDQSNPNWIVIETVIPANAGGFTVREVALFDDEENLIAIGKYPETYKPVLDEGSTKDLHVRMIIEVSNASAVTLKVDPAVIIATRKYVDDRLALTAGPLQQSMQDLKEKVGEASELDTETKISLVSAINELEQKRKESDRSVAEHLAESASDAHNATNISFSHAEMQAVNVKEGILEAFMLGNSTKQDLVDKLLLVDDSLPILYESSWQEVLDSVNQISTGKKWASGYVSGGTGMKEIRGLPFKPSIVFIRESSESTGFSFYMSPEIYFGGNYKKIEVNFQKAPHSNTIGYNNPATIYDDGFSAYVSVSNSPVVWIAIE